MTEHQCKARLAAPTEEQRRLRRIAEIARAPRWDHVQQEFMNIFALAVEIPHQPAAPEPSPARESWRRPLGACEDCDLCASCPLHSPQPAATDPSADQSDRTHAYLWMRQCAAAEATLTAVRSVLAWWYSQETAGDIVNASDALENINNLVHPTAGPAQPAAPEPSAERAPTTLGTVTADLLWVNPNHHVDVRERLQSAEATLAAVRAEVTTQETAHIRSEPLGLTMTQASTYRRIAAILTAGPGQEQNT